MTDSVAQPYTGRRSGRVELADARLADHTQVGAIYAPESLASDVVTVPAAAPAVSEGGGGDAASRPRQRARTGSQQLQAISDNLSDRDWRILRSLTAHPFLTTLHIQRLHFTDHASISSGSRICRRVLSRLAAIRAVRHLERRIGGVRAGSASFVWRLGPVGERLLQRALGGADGPRLRRKEPSLHHLDHCLAVAETHIRLLEAGRAHAPELLRLQTEPICWRPYATFGGGRAVLKPDLYAVTASGDFEDSWFIEVDRGTESLPTLLRKCGQYEEYRRSGVEQRKHNVFPRVLWLLPDARRVHVLGAALDQARSLDRSLFRVATFDELISAVIEAATND
jgi:hypothetical protein